MIHALALVLVLALAPAGLGAPPAADSTPLLEEIAALRREARYAAAVSKAEEHLARQRANPQARPHEIGDAVRLRDALTFAASLPDSAQRQLAEADRLDPILDACYVEGRSQEGLTLAERQTELRNRVLGPTDPDTAASMRRQGLFLIELGEYARARTLIREALAIQSRILGDDHPAVGSGLCEIAAVHEWLGDYDGAEALYQDCLARLRRSVGPDHPEIVSGLDLMGILARSRGNYARAVQFHREALEMVGRLRGRQHQDFAAVLQNLGSAYRELGYFAEASLLHREALTISRKALGDTHPDVAVAMHNLAATLQAQGNLAEAEDLYREVVALNRTNYGNDHPYVATTLTYLGRLLRQRGRIAESMELLEEALRIYRRTMGPEHRYVATTLRELASGESARKNHEASEHLLQEALTIDTEVFGEHHPMVAEDLEMLANERLAQGNRAEAERLLRRSLATRRELLGETHPSVAGNARDLGALLLGAGRAEEGEVLLRESARAFEIARRRVSPGLERATFQKSPYGALCAAFLRTNRTGEAWAACERDRARTLVDMLALAGARGLQPAEAAREDSLRAAVGHLEDQLAALRGSAAERTAAAGKVRADLLAIETKWISFQRELAEQHPDAEGQPFTLERVQRSIPGHAALIGWVEVELPGAPAASWGYVVRGAGSVVWVPLRPEEGSSRAGALLGELAPPGSPVAKRLTPGLLAAARDLWAERIAPLAAGLDDDVRALIVIPSGPMLGVPVEALVDDRGRFLAERFAVSYAPSGTIYARLAELPARTATDQSRAILLVGDPSLSRNGGGDGEDTRQLSARNSAALQRLWSLPWSGLEIEEIASLYPQATVLQGREASETNLRALVESGRLASFRTIHFATHALVDDERPERSALVLSQENLRDPVAAALRGDPIEDGILEAAEIAREWTLDADLVTLSACGTGLGLLVSGEGYVGLSQVFFQAGARSLLVSLWSVSDRATALLMRRFYENLEESKLSRAAALRDAKQWLRSYRGEQGDHPYEHPYYWAGFILVGDPR